MSLLFDLLEPNELDNYLFDIISDETMECIEFHLIQKLRSMDIPVLKEDIKVEISQRGINITVTEKLEKSLIELEINSPEYFI